MNSSATAIQRARRSAREADLRYIQDGTPGIRRVRCGRGFYYVSSNGKQIIAKTVLQRIRSLAIPPAYENVWICPFENGHLQATGIDARGRKQYRYHPDWRCVRDEAKFDRMYEFGRKLPAIRKRVRQDLRRHGLPKEKVLAAIVALIERTLIRVGNEEYVHENGSFGLTTLHNRHVEVAGERVVFRFRGKSGKSVRINLRDRQLAVVVGRLQDLPGQELFQYEDSAERVHAIGSESVNAYLKEISGNDFTAKDYRTWFATVLAYVAAHERMPSGLTPKRRSAEVVRRVAEKLGNTPAVCRKSYIHPAILDLCTSAVLPLTTVAKFSKESHFSRSLERAVLTFLHPKSVRRSR